MLFSKFTHLDSLQLLNKVTINFLTSSEIKELESIDFLISF